MHDQAAGIPTGARQSHCRCGGPLPAGIQLVPTMCRQTRFKMQGCGNLLSHRPCGNVLATGHTWGPVLQVGPVLHRLGVLCCRYEHACFQAHAGTSQGTHTACRHILRVASATDTKAPTCAGQTIWNVLGRWLFLPPGPAPAQLSCGTSPVPSHAMHGHAAVCARHSRPVVPSLLQCAPGAPLPPYPFLPCHTLTSSFRCVRHRCAAASTTLLVQTMKRGSAQID